MGVDYLVSVYKAFALTLVLGAGVALNSTLKPHI